MSLGLRASVKNCCRCRVMMMHEKELSKCDREKFNQNYGGGNSTVITDIVR